MDSDQTIDFSNHQVLDEEEDSHQKPTSKGLSNWAMMMIMSIFYSLFIFLTCYILIFPFDPYAKKLTLENNIALYISNSYSIFSGSLTEDIISTTASLSLMDRTRVSREPMDLAFVIDFPGARNPISAQAIQNALPLLDDKDRLLTVIFDEGSSDDSFNGPMFNFVPLASTTKQNKNTIFSNLGEEFPAKRSSAKYQGLLTAIKFLNQRENINSVTGIMLHTQECNKERISEILQGLKSSNGGPIPHAFVLCSEPQGSYIPFQANLEELQNSVIGNVEFFVKPEDSELFQGVEIVKTEFEEYREEIPHRMFIGKNLSLFPIGQRRFAIGVKIPNPTLPLPTTTSKVKIASFEMAFTSTSGKKVVKSEDFAIEIWS